MLATQAKIPIAGTEIDVILAKLRTPALVFLDIRVVEIIDAVGEVVIQTNTEFPFDAIAKLAVAAQVGTGA